MTSAYRANVPDEEIMGHSRHRSLATMRSYVRRSKLSHPQGHSVLITGFQERAADRS